MPRAAFGARIFSLALVLILSWGVFAIGAAAVGECKAGACSQCMDGKGHPAGSPAVHGVPGDCCAPPPAADCCTIAAGDLDLPVWASPPLKAPAGADASPLFPHAALPAPAPAPALSNQDRAPVRHFGGQGAAVFLLHQAFLC